MFKLNQIFRFATKATQVKQIQPADFIDFTIEKLQISTGRAWKLNELRLKSEEDLQKLWWSVIKEENIVKSEKQYKKQYNLEKDSFDSSRIIKISQTKKRILSIISEREKIRQEYWDQLEKDYLEKKQKEEQEKLKEIQKTVTVPEYKNDPTRFFSIPQKQLKSQIKKEFPKLYKEDLDPFFVPSDLKEGEETPAQQAEREYRERRRKAMSRIKSRRWQIMTQSRRKIEIAKQYAKISKDYKQKFLKELRYLGKLIKDKQSSPGQEEKKSQ